MRITRHHEIPDEAVNDLERTSKKARATLNSHDEDVAGTEAVEFDDAVRGGRDSGTCELRVWCDASDTDAEPDVNVAHTMGLNAGWTVDLRDGGLDNQTWNSLRRQRQREVSEMINETRLRLVGDVHDSNEYRAQGM